MTKAVREFVEWTNLLSTRLPEGSSVHVSHEVSDSAFVDVDTVAGAMGRLSYWSNGTAGCSVYRAQGHLTDFTTDQNRLAWANIQPGKFDVAFARFVDALVSNQGDR